MKLRSGFMLRKMHGKTAAVRIDNSGETFNGLITLNETGEMLWHCLEKGAEESDLVQAMLNEYDIDEATARNDVAEFLKIAENAGILEA